MVAFALESELTRASPVPGHGHLTDLLKGLMPMAESRACLPAGGLGSAEGHKHASSDSQRGLIQLGQALQGGPALAHGLQRACSGWAAWRVPAQHHHE